MRNLGQVHTVERWPDFPDTPGDPSLGIFGMSKRELEQLHASIKTSKGAVAMLIHPYYGSTDEFEVRVGEFVKNPTFGTDNNLPLFVLEEDHKVTNTDGRLYGLAPHTPVYIIPTRYSSGVPSTGKISKDEEWDGTINLLKRLKIQKIHLAGMDYHGTHKEYDGCVDEVFAALKGKFELEVSPLVYAGPRKKHKSS